MRNMTTHLRATFEIERLQDEQVTLTLELSPREAFTVAALIRMALAANPDTDARTAAFAVAIAEQIASFFRRHGADCVSEVLADAEGPGTNLTGSVQ